MGATGPQGIKGDPDGATGASGPQGLPGVPGDDGVPGTDGINGATGSRGATGAQGPDGATGPSGATGVGGIGATGPDGRTGATGVVGAQGTQGAQGATGVDGLQGPSGQQGSIGLIGATGPQGAPGNPSGATGPQGPQGLPGEAGIQGATGQRGAPGLPGGDPGPAGEQGATGVQGAPGQALSGAVERVIDLPNPATYPGNSGDLYLVTDTSETYVFVDSILGWQPVGSISGPQGSTGVEGPQGSTGVGLPGAQGASGPIGPQGATGPVGPQGPTGQGGEIGSTGPQGPVGPQGNPGEQGATGAQGTQGATGAQGQTGLTGSQGPIGLQGSSMDTWQSVLNIGESVKGGYFNNNAYADRRDLATGDSKDIRHIRISSVDLAGNDVSAWIESQIVRGDRLFLRDPDAPVVAYEYLIAAVSAKAGVGLDTYYDVFLDEGIQRGELGVFTVDSDIEFFNTSQASNRRSFNFKRFDEYPEPASGEIVIEDPTQPNAQGQTNFTLINKTSYFGNDQSGLLDAIVADPNANFALQFKPGQDTFCRQNVAQGHYYSDGDYYAFVGETENILGNASVEALYWDVNTAAIQYVNVPSGVSGSFVTNAGVTVTVVDGLITGIS